MDVPGENSLLTRLKRELRAGERLLWAGEPDPGPTFARSFLIYLFAVPWTAFSLFWEAMALSGWLSGEPPDGFVETGVGIVFPLFGLPFVGIGFAMLSAPFWVRRTLRRTIFGVTDTRVLLLTGGRTTKVRSVDARNLGPMTRSERASGRGTLSIETGSHRDGDGDRVTDRFEFESIEDVARVEELVRRIKDGAQPEAR